MASNSESNNKQQVNAPIPEHHQAMHYVKPEALTKQFKPTSWAVDNRIAIYIIAALITFYGVYKFVTLPKEQYPDIVVPTISITTIYAGNSAKDIESLVTQPIEKQLKSISGAKVKRINSTSQADYSLIIVEFDTDVKTELAKQKVKDAVDRASGDLPNDLTSEPNVQEFAFSEMPIMFVNLSGDFDGLTLKKYADKLQDKFEELPEVSRADIVGAPEREILVEADPVKMQSSSISYMDIENAISRENHDVSAGNISVGEMDRIVKVKGQFTSAADLYNIVVRSSTRGASAYLRDIASIKDTVRDRASYARLDGKNVVTLNIVKRAGENLINTAKGVKQITQELRANDELPSNLNIVVTGDQSRATETSFKELVNTIIIGFILVLVVLMFFMGVTNAFFVALSVPLSVFVAFVFMPLGDLIVGTSITLNFIVLFALLFGLGIIVDDAIVVIENTHRIFHNGHVPIVNSAKSAAGEIFIPVFAGTATTLAPFVPLLFWKGIIGKFMIYLPTMLILTLVASLVVAFIFNPVFAVDSMKPDPTSVPKKSDIFKKTWFKVSIALAILFHIAGWHGVGNFILIFDVLAIFYNYVLRDVIYKFQHKWLPRLMSSYQTMLQWILKGWRPAWALLILFLLFPIALGLLKLRGNGVTFFPSGDPNIIYVYLKMPVGTELNTTDSVTHILENQVLKTLGSNNIPGQPGSLVESMITNVAMNATNPRDNNRSTRSNLGRIQISFIEYEQRNGKHTKPVMDSIAADMPAIPGAQISVEQDQNGPPTDPPVNVEVQGNDYSTIAQVALDLQRYIDDQNIQGIVNLQPDVDLNNPEITINVDRTKAMSEGLSTGQIGMEIRTAIFGKEVSKLKDGEDEYEIRLRSTDMVRNNIEELINMRITFMDMNTFSVKSIPLSSIASIDYTNGSGAIKRKNVRRTIQLQSNVTDPSMTAPVNAQLTTVLKNYTASHTLPDDIAIKQSGQGEQEKETSTFLTWAMLASLGLIFLILVLQFNSLSKPFIVLSEIFFSIIGVLLGYAFTGMTISTIMFGVGILGLAGIVIKNGILLIEFTDELRHRSMRVRDAVIYGGKTRIIPVLLTALATILGLLPLAVGLNIDFVNLFNHLNPHIFFGGDNVVFWGPLSWTIIFGLIFAFFLTLMMVPSMYLIAHRLRRSMRKFYGGEWIAILGFLGPFFFIFVGIMYLVRYLQGNPVWNGLMIDDPRYIAAHTGKTKK